MQVNTTICMQLPPEGEEFWPDSFCRTSLLITEEWCDHFIWPAFEPGDLFGIRIPSGTFVGTIESTVPVDPRDSTYPVTTRRVYATGEWTGKLNGLETGLCAYGQFWAAVSNDAFVTTSAFDAAVSWRAYKLAREIADFWDAAASPGERRELLRRALSFLVTGEGPPLEGDNA